MDASFTSETSYRERDVMITECSAGLSGPILVTKLIYNGRVTDDFNVVVAPLGARGTDITETVNPLQCQCSQLHWLGEIDVRANVSLAGWAQADRGYWLDESEKREIEWGVSLSKTLGKTVDWGLCVGSSTVDLWSAARNEDKTFLGTGLLEMVQVNHVTRNCIWRPL